MSRKAGKTDKGGVRMDNGGSSRRSVYSCGDRCVRELTTWGIIEDQMRSYQKSREIVVAF